MKVKLEIVKAGRRLHEGVYEIDDTASFGAAWQDVWSRARERWMAKTSSIGDLMDSIHDGVIGELNGAEIKLSKL
ncbi:MAG TPA: hypothetical protein VL048_15950 [Xanthobacteraceae bacterium]|nr:hypothetical protein [Xanthobacteraceae bacterium]